MKEQKLNKNSNEASTRQPSDAALFDAVLESLRSVSQSGFLKLMVAIIVISFASGIKFAFMGAWPVFEFFVLHAELIYVAS